MKWLVLLVVVDLVTASTLELGDRIIATEQECARILKLNENWSTSNYHEEAAQYVDLYFICISSLNEDKNKYINENNMDLSLYPDKFAIETSGGEKFVAKPPPQQPEVLHMDTAMKIMSEYVSKGVNFNPIYRLLHLQSEGGQEIVNKQVECEEYALYAFKHPEDESSEPNHNKCLTDLYCLKQDFMDQHTFTRKDYPDFFPILYKQRGTVIRTPPKFDKSVCKSSQSINGSKRELEKWMSGVELIGEKLADIGEVGTDFIQRLLKKNTTGGQKVMTKEELADLLDNAKSVTISEDNEDDTNGDSPLLVYEDLLAEKLEELEAKGVTIAHAQLENAKPTIQKVQNMAAAGKDAIANLKDGLAANVIDKLKSIPLDDKKEDQNDSQYPRTIVDTLIDRVVNPESSSGPDSVKAPSALQILKDISKPDDNGNQSDSELKKTLRSLKESTKKRVDNLPLSKEEVLKSADIVKGVLRAVLSAASQGYGAAKDMLPQEIGKAEALVNELVNYATAEILGEKHGDNNEEGDEEDEDGEVEDRKSILNKEEDVGLTDQEPVKSLTTDQKPVTTLTTDQEPVTTSTTDQEPVTTDQHSSKENSATQDDQHEDDSETDVSKEEEDNSAPKAESGDNNAPKAVSEDNTAPKAESEDNNAPKAVSEDNTAPKAESEDNNETNEEGTAQKKEDVPDSQT